jgi:hypothetical protein
MRSRIDESDRNQTPYYNQSQYQQENSNSMNITNSGNNQCNSATNKANSERRILELSKKSRD